MNPDLFVTIERLFQGTILFAFKFVATVWHVLIRPAKNSVEAFERFRSARETEVGPATFAVISALLFWGCLTSLSFAVPDIGTDALSSTIKVLQALDASPLRVPLILTAVGTALLIALLELAFRGMAFLLTKAVSWRERDHVTEQLGAIGLYTTGAAMLIFPAFLAGLTIAGLYLDRSASTGAGVPWFRQDWVVFTGLALLLASPAIPAYAVTTYVSSLATDFRDRLAQTGLFAAVHVLTLACFAAICFVLINLLFLLMGDPRPFISDLKCIEDPRERAMFAIIEIKNTTDHAYRAKVGNWNIVLSADQRYFSARSDQTLIDDKNSPQLLLIKPKTTIYGLLRFPFEDGKGSTGVSAWADCMVDSTNGEFRFRKRVLTVN